MNIKLFFESNNDKIERMVNDFLDNIPGKSVVSVSVKPYPDLGNSDTWFLATILYKV